MSGDVQEMSGSVTYYLVQYIPDELRRESTNVGVILQRGQSITARFFAERHQSLGKVAETVARRRVRFPKIYGQWLKYWRNMLQHGEDGLTKILDAEQVNFRVFAAGTVEATGSAIIDDVADRVFMDLVDARSEARPDKSRATNARLQAAIAAEFRRRNLMTAGPFIKHPVLSGQQIPGTVAPHEPSFVQTNGMPRVMNAIGFPPSISRRGIADKAGATAFMMNDIKAMNPNSTRIAILESASSERDDVERADRILRSSARVVKWDDEKERGEFLEEVEDVARG